MMHRQTGSVPVLVENTPYLKKIKVFIIIIIKLGKCQKVDASGKVPFSRECRKYAVSPAGPYRSLTGSLAVVAGNTVLSIRCVINLWTLGKV